MNDDMLSLANRYREEVGDRLGYLNVTFLKGKIQDLALDYGEVERYLAERHIRNGEDLERFETWKERRPERESHDPHGFGRRGGEQLRAQLGAPGRQDRPLRANAPRSRKREAESVISDIVSDEDIPSRLQEDPAVVERMYIRRISRRTNRSALKNPASTDTDCSNDTRALADRRRHRVPFGHGRILQRQRRTMYGTLPSCRLQRSVAHRDR